MILDTLSRAAEYERLHPGFAAGFAALRNSKLIELPVGRYPIDGERLYLIVGRDPGKGLDAARLEAHRKYIDIQLCLAGEEVIGWKALDECQQVSEPYDEQRDIMFFADRPRTWAALEPGKFTIFFPHDAHAPLAGQGDLHKAVVKIAVDWR